MKKLLFAMLAFLALTTFSLGANIPLQQGPWDPANLGYYINSLIQSINNNVGTGAGVGAPKNFLDNGAFNVLQRGGTTLNTTCGTTSGVAEVNYGADRWGCDANVTSGTGHMVTQSGGPQQGFQYNIALYRNSGALTQPICAWQEVPSYKAYQLQGQNVILSAYEEALAGLSADNGNTTFLTVIAGGVADEGLGVLRTAAGMTASPAITPAWTNLIVLNTTNLTISGSAWGRFSTPPISIPSGTKEIAVGLCFTPASGSGGTTDGFKIDGVQLEAVGPNASAPSAFENKLYSSELLECEQYAYAFPEAASGVAQLTGQTLSVTSAEFALNFNVPMAVAPTLSQVGVAITSGTTYKVNQAGTLYNVSAMATATANSTMSASFTVTAATMSNASGGATLQGLGGGAIPLWGADF